MSLPKKRKPKPKRITLNPRVSMLIKDIDKEVRNNFKAYCVRRGITMRDRLIELMQEDIREERRRLRRVQDLGESIS